MIRQMIKIDTDKCDGCGLCVDACHEGAIEIIDGKATVIRDDYCDGLGNCLPVCPTGAIEFEMREAVDFDEEAVKARQDELANKKTQQNTPAFSGGCPGRNAHQIKREPVQVSQSLSTAAEFKPQSQLMQWPVQIKLVPVNAPYFENANLLIAADCSAYAYADFHNQFIKNKVTLIGCPKLDDVYYAEKLTEIIKHNNIKSVTVVRMSVPCCGGLENATIDALKACGKMIPWQVVTITPDGNIVD